MSNIIIRKSDGTITSEPSNTTIIQADNGVYISYDVDAHKDDFKFLGGAEILGTYYGDLDQIDDPSENNSWLSELKENF